MARAKRHYLSGCAWHITHRCHKREFLLKFGRDRRRWLQWLFEARKRYHLCILNYMVTSNHIHLLVMDRAERQVIPRSMQLLAGRTGQEYNLRKNRKGAFWEDRYHATAVETNEHLVRCIVYMDMNMVRAGAVAHPSEWNESGYKEIQSPRYSYRLIDHQCLMDLLNMPTLEILQNSHRAWVEESLVGHSNLRDSTWTESIAVGSKSFVQGVKDQLQIRAKGRQILEREDDECYLREQQTCIPVFEGENGTLGSDNLHFWNIYPNNPQG